MLRVTQAIVAVAAIAAVTACATRPKELAVVTPPPEPAPVPVYVTPPITPINRGLSPAATVWHMRVALNVAALACRGTQEAMIVQRYNALLSAHKPTLASAQAQLSEQYRVGGGDWQDRYDDAMTRLYNFFSQAQARDAFCTAAAATLTEAERLAPGELPAFAAAVLPTLDAPFAAMLAPRPMIALSAPAAAPIVGAMPAGVAGPTTTPPTPQPVAAAAAAAPRTSVTPPAAAGSRAAVPAGAPANSSAAPAVRPSTAAGAARPAASATPPAAGVRAPAPTPAANGAPAVGRRVPWIEVDSGVLQD